MRTVGLAASILLAFHQSSAAEAQNAPLRAEMSVSRHYTDNALDEPLAVSDWYTLMRGSLSGDFDHDFGRTKLTLDGELSRFDTFTIENDAAIGVEGTTTARLSESAEVQASAFLRRLRKGDAIVLDDLAIGTTTDKMLGGANLILGLRLSPSLVSTTTITGFRERAGDTRFEDDLAIPVRLEPNRDRISLSQGLTRSLDSALAIGLRGTVERTIVSELFDEQVALDRLQLRGEVGWRRDDGLALALSAGADWLRASFDLVEIVRPSIESTAIVPIGPSELRGTISTAFDTGDTDDLLVSWLRRGEIELFVSLTDTLAFKTGIFAELRDNLVLAYAEERRGMYGELGWQASDVVTFVFRIDYRRQDADEIGFAKSRLDASIGVRTKL